MKWMSPVMRQAMRWKLVEIIEEAKRSRCNSGDVAEIELLTLALFVAGVRVVGKAENVNKSNNEQCARFDAGSSGF